MITSKNNKFILKNKSKNDDKFNKRLMYILEIDVLNESIIKELFNPEHYYNWIDQSNTGTIKELKIALKKMCAFIAFNGSKYSNEEYSVRLKKFTYAANGTLNKHGTIGEIIFAIIFSNMQFFGEKIEYKKTYIDIESTHNDTKTSVDIMFLTNHYLFVNESKFYSKKFSFSKIQKEFLNDNKYNKIKNVLREDSDNSKLAIFDMEIDSRYNNVIYSLGTIDNRIDFSDSDWSYVKHVCNEQECDRSNSYHKEHDNLCEYINYFISFSISISSKSKLIEKMFHFANYYYNQLKNEDFNLEKEFLIKIDDINNYNDVNDSINRRNDILRKQILNDDLSENRNNIFLGFDNNQYDMNDYLNKNIKKLFEFNSNYDIDKREIKHLHNKKSFFFSKQYEIYQNLIKGGRYLLQAPTSFGKTMIVKEIIFNKSNYKRILIVVPTIALRIELTRNFKSIFGNRFKIINNSMLDEVPNFDFIFIATQEKMHDVKWINENKFDFVVIDEAHTLVSNNDERSYLLNKLFKKLLSKNDNILLIAPLLGSISAKTKDALEKYEFTIFRQYFSTMSYRLKKFNEGKWINQVNECILQNEKTLVYILSPKKHHEYAKKFVVEKFDYDAEIIEYLNELITDGWYVTEMLKMGVLIINGRMPNIIKEWMLNKFNNDNKYNILISNDSIVYGVNTPTQNIFIKSKQEINKNIMSIVNLIGRAGRFGYLDKIPTIYTNFDKNEILRAEDKYELKIDCFEFDSEYPDLLKKCENNYNYDNIVNDLSKSHSYKKTKINHVYSKLRELIRDKEKINFNLFKNFIWLNIDKSINKSFEILQKLMNLENISSFKKLYWSLGNGLTYDIDTCIEFYYTSFPYKIKPAIRIIFDIAESLEGSEAINLNKIKEVKKIVSMILEKYNSLYFNTPSNLSDDMKVKYESICSSLREMGFLSTDINEISSYLLDKLPNNYGNYDIDKILLESGLKLNNPFGKK